MALRIYASVGKFSNQYLVCRFNECVLINPSHDYENVYEELGLRTLKAILITNLERSTIYELDYYNAPVFLLKKDYENLTKKIVRGYTSLKPLNFDPININLNIIEDGFKLMLANEPVIAHEVFGAKRPLVVYQIGDMLFGGNLFSKEGKLISKNQTKRAIYKLKEAILNFKSLDPNTDVYLNYGTKTKLQTLYNNSEQIKKWIR